MSLSEKFGIPASLLDAAKKTLAESDAYQQKVKAHMAKKGVKSLNDMTPEQKKKFFNELDAMHTAKNEEVELEEATVIGKPEIKGPSQHRQHGTPGDTHTSVTTHHKVGAHHYKVTTEIDHDGDKFHTVHKTDSAGRKKVLYTGLILQRLYITDGEDTRIPKEPRLTPHLNIKRMLVRY